MCCGQLKIDCSLVRFRKSQEVDMVQGQLDGAFISLSQSALKSACLLTYKVRSPSLTPNFLSGSSRDIVGDYVEK